MNHKSFVSCKLHSLLGFFLMPHFMEAPGMAGKAAKEGGKFTLKAVGKRASLLESLRIEPVLEVTAMPHLCCHVPSHIIS